MAILYQAKFPPIQNGIQKSMKPGGYSDSGADIAYELKKNGISIVLPVSNPDIKTDLDWVFPDTKKGIQDALDKGANAFWLNIIKYQSTNTNRLPCRREWKLLFKQAWEANIEPLELTQK